jgi:hypothetical protein
MVVAVVISSLTTWVAAQQIRSPAEEAARTAPPTPSPILVPVEEKVLTSRVVTRGTGQYGSLEELTVTPSALKSGTRVITSLPAAGAVVGVGDVLLTISGRPVLALVGEQPAHRDLGLGMSGADVEQLEQSLADAGVNPGAVDGTWDVATSVAVALLYVRHGYRPVVATEAQLRQARPREAGMVEGTRARPGVQLPADEMVFVPQAPLRVAEVPGAVGGRPDGPLVSVTSSQVEVTAALPIEQAALVKPGAQAVLDEPAVGINATGRVAAVADRPGTGGADQFHVAVRVTVDNPPPTLVGTSVRITLPIESTEQAQLTVPVSAVSLGPDGGSRVQVADSGDFRFVPVTTGLSADGYVAITPADGERLAAGDEVVVGFENPPQAEG